MDSTLRQVVQQLLRPTDTCIHAIQGQLLGVQDLSERLCAIVKHERKQEFGLLVLTVDRLHYPPHYIVEAVYPIKGDFSARIQVTKGGWCQVLVVPGDGSSLVFNFPVNQYPQIFISQLHQATSAQSTSVNSMSPFDWLVGYETCRSGWDRFSKPGPSHTTPHSVDPFQMSSGGPGSAPLDKSLPEKWPWSHIITPNSDGSTDIATCEHYSSNDLSEFDPLFSKPQPETTVAPDITFTDPSPTSRLPPSQSPFVSTSTNPFESSTRNSSPDSQNENLMPSPPGKRRIRVCTSESNLRRLRNESSRQEAMMKTRSTEDLTSSGEVTRHCVAGMGRGEPFSGSTSSLSNGEQENGDMDGENRHGIRRRAGNREVSAGERYSKFEVISDSEIVGRKRLNHSPDLREMRRARDSLLRSKKPTGSKPGVSKANMDQPELTSQRKQKQSRSETRPRSSSRWVSRYIPGVPVPMRNARESIVQAEFRLKEAEFCDKKKLRVFCGTWNVNGKAPPSTLDQFLLEVEGQGEEGQRIVPDIYAIGFQELDLSAQALMGVESSREEVWTTAVDNTLRKALQYHKLLHVRLVGILLLIYIKPDLLDSVSDTDVASVTTGIGGVLGNKGGVGARFNIFHSSLCFINCHFAASMDEVEKRNQDYYTIRNKMMFDKVSGYRYSVMEHDIVFWLGDMNYRIQTSPEMTVEMIRALADNLQISSLLERDQMVQEMTKGTIFSDFSEGAIDFKPTYKYDVNSDEWDSDKNRPPAWCDRVLYYGMGVDLRGYRSHPKMKISDHKPVSAVFNCDVRVVDTQREKNVLEEITRKLDKLENDTLPQVDLSGTEFIFEDVKFEVPQSRILVVTNTGMRPVLVSFIPKLDEETYCKPWVEAKPSSAIVQPLQDVNIVLTVLVDSDTAASVNVNSGQNIMMEDILVLHLEGGKDFFISIAGNYLPSCFGSSLELLVQLHTYVRDVPVEELVDLSLTSSWEPVPHPPSSSSSSSPRTPSPSNVRTTPAHDIPKELFQIVSYLDNHALTQESLFQEGGRQMEMEEIRDALDKGGTLSGSPHSMASCLLLFLSALSEPVIPIPLHHRAMECCHQPMLCKQLLLNLTKVHQRTFIFLISFMKRLLSHSEDNGLDPKLLATIFGDILLRAPANERRTLSKKQLGPISRKKATFVYQFLVNDLTVDYR